MSRLPSPAKRDRETLRSVSEMSVLLSGFHVSVPASPPPTPSPLPHSFVVRTHQPEKPSGAAATTDAGYVVAEVVPEVTATNRADRGTFRPLIFGTRRSTWC